MRIQEGVYVCGVQALHYDLQAMDDNGHGNMWCFGLTVVVWGGGAGGSVGCMPLTSGKTALQSDTYTACSFEGACLLHLMHFSAAAAGLLGDAAPVADTKRW